MAAPPGFAGPGTPTVQDALRLELRWHSGGAEGPAQIQAVINGGQLSAGRLHGLGFLHEAVLQLRGEAGGRQVPGAEVAVVANGGGPLAGAMLLTRS